MGYAWLIRVGHNVYGPKEITPVQERLVGVYVNSQRFEENSSVRGRRG